MKNNEIPLLPQTIYHIYNHANGKENLFANHNNYLFFLQRYNYFIHPIAETYAYCLMPNHIHFMVGIKNEKDLQQANIYFQKSKGVDEKNLKLLSDGDYPAFISKTFGNLFSSYSQAFNKQQNRKGSLFIPNFKRKIVDNTAYYSKLIFYIHNNPVHHQFVTAMEDWKFSSYQSYLMDKKTKVEREKVLEWFGSLQEFKNFHSSEKLDINFDL